MKTVVIEFESVVNAKEVKNHATIIIRQWPGLNSGPYQVLGFTFDKPVKRLRYTEFLKLNSEINRHLNELNAPAVPEVLDPGADPGLLTPSVPALSSKKIEGFAGGLMKVARDLDAKGKLSPGEKNLINRVFGIFGELMNYPKK